MIHIMPLGRQGQTWPRKMFSCTNSKPQACSVVKRARFVVMQQCEFTVWFALRRQYVHVNASQDRTTKRCDIPDARVCMVVCMALAHTSHLRCPSASHRASCFFRETSNLVCNYKLISQYYPSRVSCFSVVSPLVSACWLLLASLFSSGPGGAPSGEGGASLHDQQVYTSDRCITREGKSNH